MDGNRSPVKLRVVDQFRKMVDGIFDLFRSPHVGPESSHKLRLHRWQLMVSACDTAKDQAAREWQIADAAVKQMEDEAQQLLAAGYHQVLGCKTEQEFTRSVFEPLAARVHAFFSPPSYYVGKSQRFAVFVFNEIPWKVQLEKLAAALSRPPTTKMLHAVGEELQSAERPYELVIEPGFAESYAARERVSYPSVTASTYLLTGVNCGKDTQRFTAKESLAYFAKEGRYGLTLKSAMVPYTNRPDFLFGENASVILLGEKCGEKYVTLTNDQDGRKLRVGLVTLDEADRIFRPHVPGPNDFSGDGVRRVAYGKPSAGAVILP